MPTPDHPPQPNPPDPDNAVIVAQAKATCLEHVTETHRTAVAAIDNRIDAMRMAVRFGATWTELGAAMGMSKQAAHSRFAESLRVKANGKKRS